MLWREFGRHSLKTLKFWIFLSPNVLVNLHNTKIHRVKSHLVRFFVRWIQWSDSQAVNGITNTKIWMRLLMKCQYKRQHFVNAATFQVSLPYYRSIKNIFLNKDLSSRMWCRRIFYRINNYEDNSKKPVLYESPWNSYPPFHFGPIWLS